MLFRSKLTDPEPKRLHIVCEEVSQRANFANHVATQTYWLLGVALEKLTLARTTLYVALLDAASSPVGLRRPVRLEMTLCDSAVDDLRQAGDAAYLPRGLLTRAWVRWLNGDEAGCRADLDEAWEIAEPGPMRLRMADILLYRARLFRDKGALAEARKLIELCGYWRRKEELEDAEAALA